MRSNDRGSLTAWLDDLLWDRTRSDPRHRPGCVTGDVLMFAWNELRCPGSNGCETGEAVYFSRSRGKVVAQGRSPATQKVPRDPASVRQRHWSLLKIEQVGGIACHAGLTRHFFQNYYADGRGISKTKDIYK